MLGSMTSAKSTSPESDSGSRGECPGLRLDRWLWAARFFKTRSLAKAAVEGGRVHLEGQRTKPAKEVHVGQTLEITRGSTQQTIVVRALSEQRGPAKVAQTLYAETAASIEAREAASALRRMQRAGLVVPERKPSKRDRRELKKLKSQDAEP